MSNDIPIDFTELTQLTGWEFHRLRWISNQQLWNQITTYVSVNLELKETPLQLSI